MRGWSVDDIVGWEIILADGSVTQVTTEPGSSLEDLAWALKGGHKNFGVVTRFDMLTFPVTAVYGGLTIYDVTAESKLHDALVDYMAPGSGSDNPKSAINAIHSMSLVDGSWQYALLNIHLYADGESSPWAMENFLKILDD
ncbi:hypothetical protein HD806DRAFT_548756 [Xylariaceae sp. AK1471]|nr:hypothetical protein HD806DRAFT_548756 [Xylariaceae sp. AK1471]